jgi:hypothetical protein
MKQVTLAAVIALVIAASVPAFAGNGAPSGSHYNLNIIGMETCKQAALTDSNRHTIFVDLNSPDPTPKNPTPITELNPKNKIFLQEGPFQVIDGNACDGATFQLPKNDCTIDGITVDVDSCDYQVYIRALGSPKDNPFAQMTTCRTDTVANEFQCSTETVNVTRSKGKSTFTNVTKELTTLCLDTDADTVCDTRVLLFEDEAFQYFWDYDNHGLRLAQIRFYPLNP